MPTILRIGSYRFFFYSNEMGEPPHIHIQSERKLAKFWLQPVQLAGSTRITAHELNRLNHLVEANKEHLPGAWNEYFSD
jgi:hypothetical protein